LQAWKLTAGRIFPRQQMGAQPMGPNGETVDELALKRYPDTQRIEHVHTAGNSSGIVDGSAVVLLGSAEFGQKAGQKPRARVRAMATIGAEPLIMLTALAPASAKALKKAGMTVKDIGLWEINEAFAPTRRLR
jgi:acetyl-CoA C-acetyltransferase